LLLVGPEGQLLLLVQPLLIKLWTALLLPAAAAVCYRMLASIADTADTQTIQQPQPTIFMNELLRAGFRADRLSVWVLQGLHDQGLGQHHLQHLLAEITNCAAFHSLFVGELPGPMSRRDAENLLAEAGLLGAVTSYEAADNGQYGRWRESSAVTAAAAAADVNSLGVVSAQLVLVGMRWRRGGCVQLSS